MSYQYRQQNSKHPANKGQEGVVIIVALFIVALIAAMAYTMMARLSRDTRETSLLVHSVDAEFLAQGSIAWAVEQLRNDVVNRKQGQLVDLIPIQSPVREVNGYQIKSTIYDLQSRFNLNNLSDQKNQNKFLRLLKLLKPDINHEIAVNILMATIDWIKPGSQENEFTKYYLELHFPYRAAHKPMVNASELKLVKGMTPEIYHVLQPYIVALPSGTKINLQTAPAPVLASLSDKVSLQDANTIVNMRTQKPLSSDPAAYDLDVIKSGRFPLDDTVVQSQYFLVETKVDIDGQHILIYTLLNREDKNGRVVETIIGQSKGTW
jgi:general secretion pathway protein K